MLAVLEYKVAQLEAKLTALAGDLEPRVRALEIAHARIIGWATGGAFMGGLAWSALQWILR